MVDDRFRLVTRSDFDGLVCAVLLKELDLIDEVKFVCRIAANHESRACKQRTL